ncbi:MAG: hypothetical protein M1491_08755 [Deltaproteobacteria bacterium]|nr:hypothetical protein [Deltaproteobacteria bacterium]MCL5277964.1 hypothetical protein [Deltaproteobacteria bacterium]
MKILKNTWAILLMALLPEVAMASSPINIDSSTYFGAYGLNMNNMDNSYIPFYEDLNLAYPVTSDRELSIEASGWLRYDLLNTVYTNRTAVDMPYGYLDYRPKSAPIALKVGRISSWFGAANDRYDGLELMLGNLYGLGLGAFVGSEVDSELHDAPGGVTTGGRLSYSRSLFGVGGSIFYAENSGDISQERWGIDGWIKPVDMLYLFGRYYYDMIDKRAYDGTLKLSLTPIKKVFVDAQYALFDPASLIDKTSIFWVFNTESYRTVTANVGYRIIDALSLSLDGTRYMYSSDGNAYSYGGTVDYDMRPYAMGLELKKVDSAPTDYLRTRLYLFRSFVMGFYANIEVIYTSYLGELNGYDHSIVGHAAVGKTITNDLKLTLSGDSIDGPFIRHGGFGMLSLKYGL